ncbi:hypothetical protein T484DRAFT_1756222 [Baffinella frigidus]|nr:hypothetical protein T484DRAFT_1756222 [Cryptophyta sp. CCMP2293]
MTAVEVFAHDALLSRRHSERRVRVGPIRPKLTSSLDCPPLTRCTDSDDTDDCTSSRASIPAEDVRSDLRAEARSGHPAPRLTITHHEFTPLPSSEASVAFTPTSSSSAAFTPTSSAAGDFLARTSSAYFDLLAAELVDLKERRVKRARTLEM